MVLVEADKNGGRSAKYWGLTKVYLNANDSGKQREVQEVQGRKTVWLEREERDDLGFRLNPDVVLEERQVEHTIIAW